MEGLVRDFGVEYLLEWVLLSAIFAVGCHTAYTDIHWRRIPNWATWGLLALGVAGHALFWALGKSGLPTLGTTFLAGLGVGLVLFLSGFWAPGDAKLYWGVLVALPPTLYRPRGFLSFEWVTWALLLNALLLNLLVMLVYAGIQRFSAGHVGAAGDWLPARRIWQLGLEIGGLVGWVVGGAGLLLAGPLSFIHAAVAVVLGYLVVDRMVPRDYRIAVVAPGLLAGGYTAWSTDGWLVVVALWAFGWVSHVAHDLLAYRFRRYFRQELDLDSAAVGMVPCAGIWGEKGADGRTRYVCGEKVAGDAQEVVCQPGRMLDEVRARRLREMTAGGLFSRFGGRIVMETSMPLAPVIVAAAGVTALVGGSLVRPMGKLASVLAQALH